MKRSDRSWIGAAAFTTSLLLLIVLANAPRDALFAGLIIVLVSGGAAIIYAMFRGTPFFAISFAAFIAVYTCFFIFLAHQPFAAGFDPWIFQAGFTLPILTFLSGVGWYRRSIRELLQAPDERLEKEFKTAFLWFLSVFVLIGTVYYVSQIVTGRTWSGPGFLVAMGVVAAVTFAKSYAACAFLLKMGLIFAEFFDRIGRLMAPIFAFLTFYSLVVIVFASLYRIIDFYSAAHHFVIRGEIRDIEFLESLYFSVISLSTVGYGDIIPSSDAVRLIVAIQVVCGVLLLVFGVTEILQYSRDENFQRNGDN